jgi:hypothetical protein
MQCGTGARPGPARTHTSGAAGPCAGHPVNGGEMRLCACQLALVPCPQGDGCAKQSGSPLRGWVHKATMGHECPSSGRKLDSGLVIERKFATPVTP